MADQRNRPVPYLCCALPGPEARRMIAEDERHTSPSYTRVYPLVVARGEGAVIEDVDGNRFLDFTAGIAVTTTGHCHPRIVQAIHRQAEALIHMSGTDFYYGPQIELAKRLAGLAPSESPYRVFFTNSGTEAVEAAIKLARHQTGRPAIIGFYGGFHGRTMGALSVTASKVVQRAHFGPLLPQVYHVGYGDCYRCPYGRSYGDCSIQCASSIEETLFRHVVAPDEVAAIVVEPIQGEGGYIVPPPEFLPRLREIADRHGILLVMDEIQSGMGRTGRMFACQHWHIEPDILCIAKGLASGLPLGAMIARESIMNWPPGSHASTFGGNPVACAAALETISLLEEGLMENAAAEGEFLLAELRRLAERYPSIGDVRGKGLMIGIDLIRDPLTREPSVEKRESLIHACFHKGLLLLGCGRSTVRLCPPLIITRRDSQAAVAILAEALAEL